MKTRFAAAFAFTALLGTGLHFLYPLCPCALVGLFAPVNESVWEHLKLLYWPFFPALFFLLHADAQRTPGLCGGLLLAQLLMPCVLLGAYYTLSAGFCVQSLGLDIALYLLTLALGFFLSYRLRRSKSVLHTTGVLVLAVGLYGAALILLSIAPPPLPIFLD